MTILRSFPNPLRLLALACSATMLAACAATPVAAVRRLTAAQGQDLPGALLSVALRTTDGSPAGVTVPPLDRAGQPRLGRRHGAA